MASFSDHFSKLGFYKNIHRVIDDYLDIIEPLIGKLPIRTISKIFSKRIIYEYKSLKGLPK